MKELIITLKDMSEIGGGERVAANLANLLSPYYKIHIISLFKSRQKPFYALNPNIKLIFISHSQHRPKNPLKRLFTRIFYRFFLIFKAHFKIKAIAKNKNLIAVISNDGAFLPILKIKNLKYMRLFHLNAPKKRRASFGYHDELIILSNKELSIWQHYHKKISVIPNFIPEIPSENADLKSKIILSAGRLSEEKGFLRLLEIWALVLKNGTKWAADLNLNPSESAESSKNKNSVIASEQSERSNFNNKTKSNTNIESVIASEQSERGNPINSFTNAESKNARLPRAGALAKALLSLVMTKTESNIKSAQQAQINSWKLRIVGSGALENEIKNKIKELNLSDFVEILPFTREIEMHYKNASIFALASFFEGFGMVLAEAGSYGIPAVSFDIKTGPSDIIDDKISGFLANDGDLEGFGKMILGLMLDSNLREKMGKEAKNRIKNHFSKEAILPKWRAILED